MTVKAKVVSGMRPTGRLHLGNYWGALSNWIGLQDKYDCSFFVADWHALTTGYEETLDIEKNSEEMVADWLSCGLDPEKCVIFQQSKVPEHAEMNLLLGMITPLGWLLRNPTYKEQLIELYKKRYAGQEHHTSAEAGKNMQALASSADISEKEMAALSDFSGFGFLGYPVLMATDILIHKGELVPVGQDQVAHLEITRDIARRFASLYGKDILVEPRPLLTQVPKVPGPDGRKMSKSYGNTIELGEEQAPLKKKIMSMFTDPAKKRANDKGNPDDCVVFSFHKVYNPACAARHDECVAGSIGCVKCKEHLFGFVDAHIEQIRQKRKQFGRDYVREVLNKGNEKARASAIQTLSAVRKAMHIG